MKNSILFIFLFLVASVYSQSPDWSVNASSYQYNMTFTVFLNVNGTVLTNTNDKVGAFVNGENRGEATVVYNANAKKYVAYLTVLANTAAETINFKIYDSTNDLIIDVPKTEIFEINKNIGGAFQSYSIAAPILSSQAEISSFSFQGVSIESTSIANNTINIEVLSTVDITNLTPVFTTTNNGKIYIDKILQVSSNNTLDFSNDVVYELLSEDESQKVEYTVKVKKIVNTASNDITFSDATFTFDGTEKTLQIEGNLPSGTSVSYTNNGLTNVGSKQVTATISGPNFQDVVLTANLKVTQATITGVSFSDAIFTFDGTEKKITIVGSVPNGTSINYVLNTRTNAGKQEAFALITGDNYVNLVLKANLIVNEAVFGGFTLSDKNYDYDGVSKSILISEVLPTGTSVSYLNNNKTNAGVYEVVATISKENYKDLILKATLTIAKLTLNNLSFEDEVFVYDETPKSLKISGNLPTEVSVSYTNNAFTEAGVYEVEATISGGNYEDLILKANLTIIKATLNDFSFKDESFVYDGTIKSLKIVGDLPTGVSVSYTNNNHTDVGSYEVTATISGANYISKVLKETLTISKATLKSFTFKDENFVYDGVPKSIKITECLPSGTSVTYTNNNLSNVGVYEVEATISGANYEDQVLKATLTISKATLSGFSLESQSFVYNGAPKSLKIVGDLPTGVSVSYTNNSFTEAGSYQVTATIFGDNYEDLVLKANLTITKVALSGLTFNDESFVYNGAPKSLKIVGDLPTGVSVSYTNNSFTEAGSYQVTATIFGDNYEDLVLKANLTITKVALSGLTFNDESFVFNGTPKSLNIVGDLPTGVSVSYTNNAFTEAGVYEVEATISGANYEDQVLKATLTISKATLSGFSLESQSFVYNGAPKSLKIVGDLPTGVSVSYTNNSFTEAGSYQVTATISGANYEDLVLKANLTIAKATLSGLTFNDDSFVYNGTPKSLKIVGDLPTGVSVSYTNNAFTEAGVYEVEATISGANYEDQVLKATLTIAKATLSGFSLASQSFVYNGAPKSLKIVGDLPTRVSVSYTNNSFTETGVYEVTATIFGDNYEELVLKSNLTITKATLSGLTFNDESFVYSGTPKSLKISGDLPTGVSVSYTNNAFTEAGVYEVTATIFGDNYEDLVLKANLTITKATLSGLTFNDESFVYNGTPKSLKISGDLPIGVSVSYTNNAFTEAGVYEVEATISGANYEDQVLKATLTIAKATLSGFSLASQSFVYNGAPKSLKIVGDLPMGVSVSYTNNAFTEAGSYQVTATISGANYEDLVLKANLTIAKATLSGLTFNDDSFVYNGTPKSLKIVGDLPTGVSVSYTNNAFTEAGVYEVEATISGANYEDQVLKATLTIAKATLSGFSLASQSFVYNGAPKSLKIVGDLPTGVSVSYTNNSFTETGVYEVTATIFGDNYEELVLKSNLTITKATLSGLTFNDESFVYSGTPKSLKISGDLPMGVSVSYTNNAFTEAGVYEVTATIFGDNYEDLVLKANLTITKATLSGLTFNDESFVYNGTPKSLKISGDLPMGVSVSYTNNAFTEAGVYEVEATISGANYEDQVLKATLTIAKATLSGLTFNDESFVYNGAPKSLKIVGDLPTGVSVSYTNNAFTEAGSYEVTAIISSANYENLILKANLIISKAEQTITFNKIIIPSDKNEFNLEASSSSGLQITYVSSNTNVAIVSGDLVFLVGNGVAIITANQLGNNNFNAAISKSQEINTSTLGAKNNIFEKKSILLYPNPVNETLKLKLNSEQTEAVLIFDTTGKMVKMIKDYQSEKNIDVSNFNAGNYFIKLRDANGLITVKSFIKK
ncbi:MBG domain-containing protein [Polaribacter staleyi]|uniref:MBG domain-containing protein n=1 Tax=Polaribacter staleyi TaxID=2022337 RepID=UPI0031BB9670